MSYPACVFWPYCQWGCTPPPHHNTTESEVHRGLLERASSWETVHHRNSLLACCLVDYGSSSPMGNYTTPVWTPIPCVTYKIYFQETLYWDIKIQSTTPVHEQRLFAVGTEVIQGVERHSSSLKSPSIFHSPLHGGVQEHVLQVPEQ